MNAAKDDESDKISKRLDGACEIRSYVTPINAEG